MKYLIEADVEGETTLQETTSFKHREREYIFHRDDRGLLTKITIVAPAPDPSRFYTEFRTGENPSITLGSDRGLRTELLSDLQQIEGLLAFHFKVSRIRWDTARSESVAETEEERGLGAYSLQSMRLVPDWRAGALTAKAADELTERIVDRPGLTIPLSFWREGNNDLRSFRFINAFFNFYFVLEGHYANGKTGNDEVARQFMRSDQLKRIISRVLPAHLKNGETPNALMQALERSRLDATIGGVLTFLIGTRGEVHHYSERSTRSQGNPLNQENYSAVAFLAGHIATDTLRYRLARI